MTDEQSLLAAIHANPDDDLPRLVYADWLEESGDEAAQARAEFIRHHVRLATLDEIDPEYDTLDQRCRELLETHWSTWAADSGTEDPNSAYRYGYYQMHRGFSDRTYLSDTDLDESTFQASLLRHTLTDITLCNLKADSPLPDWPRLQNVRKLFFYNDAYERDEVSVRRLLSHRRRSANCGNSI
ncbi:TIGR02996 domain-containing protein [Limnoglobus roseus]|uniref:TIGR02996 domain-containing protein n=1 Tax=Limnoglobus roseus TaxID=2598579 RepID=A0A5C1AB59_9BACT|nr:TIGR02996 domain-containing protein [Limnoglobus roseus]QEL15256.1 TIGR02996 domain-containing protein [Limnoglobus roseus]